MTTSHWRRVVACTGLGLVGLLVSTASPVAAAGNQSLHGTFRETAAGADLGYNISGSAKLTIGASTSTAKVNVAGLDVTKIYASHLHNGTCAIPILGGGHYRNNVSGPAVPPNELWLSSTANPLGGLVPNNGGVAHGDGSFPWAARTASPTLTNARSIVVHEPISGARIACADLS